MAGSNIIDELMQSPEAPVIASELQHRLQKEQEKRQAFYDSLSAEEHKVEFINGEVIVQSPVQRRHGLISGNIYSMIKTFVIKNGLGEVFYEKAMIRLTRNDYEPDVCYFDAKQVAAFDEHTSLFPAPRLVVEVLSPKTEARDRGIKFKDYAYHAIPEYWIVDPAGQTLEQYVLQEGTQAYQLHKKSDDGEVEVQVLPGLCLPIPAFFDEREAQRVSRRAGKASRAKAASKKVRS
jgi:Uma2 family endonuclease